MSGSFLVLAEFGFAFLFHSIAIVRILLILRNHARKGISMFFMALLINWLFAALLLLPYEAHALAIWRPESDVLHNARTLFFVAMPAHILLAAIPVSVFFLTADRICIIRFGHNYGHKTKAILKYAYFGILIIELVYNLGGFLSALPLPAETLCEIFGCILGASVQYYLGWRAFCAVFNIVGGVIFFILFFRSNQQMLATNTLDSVSQEYFRRTTRANNIMTAIAVINELLLSFLPHFGPLLWEKIVGPGSSLGTGPLSEVMSSVEVLIFSSIYSRVLSRRNASSTSHHHPHGSETKVKIWQVQLGNRRRSERIAPAELQLAQQHFEHVVNIRVDSRPKTSMALTSG